MSDEGAAQVTRYLLIAEAFLTGEMRIQRVPSARAACWVARRGLETMVPLLLRLRCVDVGRASMNVQLICLRVSYVDNPALFSGLASAWDQLSRACHHHAYELTPTITEVRELIGRVRAAEKLLEVTTLS
jgi:hypothetical protein